MEFRVDGLNDKKIPLSNVVVKRIFDNVGTVKRTHLFRLYGKKNAVTFENISRS